MDHTAHTTQVAGFVTHVYEMVTLGDFIDTYGISPEDALTLTPTELRDHAVAVELTNYFK